jgi:3-dehydroquinate synthase II
MTLPKILVRTDHLENAGDRKDMADAARAAGYTAVILRPGDTFTGQNRFTADGIRLMCDGKHTGTFLTVTAPEDLEEAYRLRDTVPLLVLEFPCWKVIPLENLIARFQGSATKIYVCAKTREEADLAFAVMEKGSDGVVLMPSHPPDIPSFPSDSYPGTDLKTAGITGITGLATGDRVCIDTTSLLEPGEVMLIGSASSCLFPVCSESFENGYLNARPFRVNAGAVHSYILCPDGTTKYLSEIAAGTELLTRKQNGTLRTVTVGRVKIERRPMLLIKAGESGSVILQNAETVRILTPDGPKSVTGLTAGDTVYVRSGPAGRHSGHPVDETVYEK